ncbi:hypothetical protein [Carnobacterium sp. ISL-102]|uniref:hypothetical protein n=1 Tax=Carnobacterium sp. ISL-102 TaxID=2819142 RepID=UPI001BE981DE|nr:hypothetical protein [Carnobacterium sp. ISL-102]
MQKGVIEIENEEMVSLLKKVDTEIESIKEVTGSEDSGGRVAKAKKAKMLALNNIKAFYYTSENLAYVKIDLGKYSEIVRTDSKTFKHWLIYLFERTENTVLSDGDIKTAISSIDSVAFFRGFRVDIYLRIAEKDNSIYIDLCNEKRQTLEINADGFKILDESPVLFRRMDDMDEIPIPILENTNDYMKLGNYLNFDKMEDFNMTVAFLLASFRPSMPKPLINFTGEAGTGKSMNTRLIRKFIDPAKQKDLLKKEINMNEIPLAATSQYLMAFDNLSGISKEGSDLLCIVSTGGVMTTRRLYTNSDEIIVDLKKVVILNGIDEISKRQDLVSRTIFIETPRLKSEEKKTEYEIWSAFKKDYPYILGSLVNAVSTGLRNKGKDTSSYSRMIDFGRFIAESSEALNWEDDYWQTIYSDNQVAGVEQSINSDPFALAVVEMMEQLATDKLTSWRGTSSELLKKLADNLPSEDTIYNRAWPKYNQVKGRLRRIAPLMATKGIEWSEARSNGKHLLVLTTKEMAG